MFLILRAGLFLQYEKEWIRQRSVRDVTLARTKALRSSVFGWMTLIAVIISEYQTSARFFSYHFIIVVLLAPLCTFFAALGAYIANDLSDVKVDAINSPNRPIVTKTVKRDDAIFLVILSNAASLGLASLLGFPSLLIILLEFVGSVMYSFKPIGVKNRFVWKTLSIGIAGSVSSIFGAIALGNGITSMTVYAATMSFTFLFVTSPLNDLGDRVGDCAEGRRTIPIVMGREKTLKLSLVASFIPFVTSIIFLHGLNTAILMTATLAMVSLRSAQLLNPLTKCNDSKTIKMAHRRMVGLHFVVQCAILIGALSFT